MVNTTNFLINKEHFLDDIFNNSYVAILVVDSNRNIVLVNNRMCQMSGYKKEELIKKNVSFLHINQKHYDDFGEMVFNHVISKKSMSIDFEFRKKDGTQFWAKISGDPLKHQDYVLWTLIDVTEIYEIHNALKEQRNLLKMLINQIPYPVLMKDYNGKFILVNEATAKLYDSTPDEMINKDDGDYIPNKKMADFFRKNAQEIMDKGEAQIVYEDSINTKTNEIRNYMAIKKPFKNSDGKNFILVLANDITELNRKNDELAQKERIISQQSKLASMGEMLANIAHQWRQPLSAISTQATGLRLEKEMGTLSDERLDDALININSTTQFLSQTIDDFRNFYNPENKNKKSVMLSKIVDKTLKILDGQLKSENIKIIKYIVDYELYILENELMQVLMNILNNSKDALLKVKEDRLIIIKACKRLENLIIEIFDNGKGIDKKILNKIFEPYFTTKHKSIGTGIGLYMSEKIVVNHLNGQINASNSNFNLDEKKYFGAKFIIKIPFK